MRSAIPEVRTNSANMTMKKISIGRFLRGSVLSVHSLRITQAQGLSSPLFLRIIMHLMYNPIEMENHTEKQKPADILFTGGLVHTLNSECPRAEAVAVSDNTIIYVGDSRGARAFTGKNTRIINLENRMLLPAFVDAHMHPAMSAVVYLHQAALYDVFTHEEYIAVIGEFAATHPDLESIQGAGFKRTLYDERGPLKDALDEIDATRPIRILSVDDHSAWVNTRTLELAGIDASTEDPAGGVIKRNPETGEPTGLLQESAMALVAHLFPSSTRDEYKSGLLWLQERFNALGITTIHDAMVPFDPDYYMAYEELAREGRLSIRYRGSWCLTPEMPPGLSPEEAVRKGMELSGEFRTPYWRVDSFKFFADQVIEEETGFLKESYAHRNDGWCGIRVWDDGILKKLFTMIDAENLNIHIHQIGDAAAACALDALEYARERNGPRDSRHSLAHIQMMDPREIRRMAALGMNGITAPYWQIIDDYFWDLYLPYLGKQRAFGAQYPMKSLFDAGINVALHSDFFVTEPDYSWALYSAITRTMPRKILERQYGAKAGGMLRTTDPDTKLRYYDMGSLGPREERISLEEALQAATYNGAYADFLENEIGSIEVGKKADLIVIDRNLFEADVEDIPDFKVLMTLFEGRIVYDAGLKE